MSHALKARVRNGRLVLDVPTDLPEGAEVELVQADGDDLTPDERAELHAALGESIAQMREGRLVDGEAVIAELRKRA